MPPKPKKKKRKRDQSRYWVLALALGCSLVAFAWILVPPRHDGQVPEYSPHISDLQEKINYPALIDKYDGEDNFFNHLTVRGLLGFIALMVIAPILMVIFAKAKRVERAAVLLPFILPGMFVTCWGTIVGCRLSFEGFFSDWTYLEHMATVEFDGHIYQLAHATGMAGGWDVSIDELYVYQCDLNGVDCIYLDHVPQRLYRDNRPIAYMADPNNASFVIDQKHDQLQVRESGAVFFALDAQRDVIP